MIPACRRTAQIPKIGHREAMRLTAIENARLHAQLRALGDEQWVAATDCRGWTVRDIAVHLIASAQAQASPIEFARQVVGGRRLTARVGGGHWVDGLNEAQLRARAHWPGPLLPQLWHWTLHDTIAEADRVMSLSSWTGTHRGEFLGIAPTGRSVTVEAWTLDRYRAGRLVESRIIMDIAGLLGQLGVRLAPTAG